MAEVAAQQGAIVRDAQRLGARLGAYCEEERGLRPPRTVRAVTLPSYAPSYDLSWPGLSRQRAPCPVRTHLRFSAAQAAKRSTKSSKPKQGQRRSISKSHAVFAGDHSLPAKGFVLKYFLLRKAIPVKGPTARTGQTALAFCG